MNIYTVYEHINKTNGKRYIGITCKDVKIRWGKDGSHYKCSTYFYNAIKKYSWDGFDHNIIKNGLSEYEAKLLEIELIKLYDTTNSKKGYNLTYGGQGNIPTDSVREKMSSAQIEVWRNIEYKNKMVEIRKTTGATKELKEKISIQSKLSWQDKEGRTKRIQKLKEIGQTEEFRNKMRLINIGEGNGFYGKKHLDASKKIMRDKKLGGKLTEEHKQKVSEALKKKVVQLDLTGKFIAIHNGISHINIIGCTSHITACCQNKRKTTGGFKWMYYNDYVREYGDIS